MRMSDVPENVRDDAGVPKEEPSAIQDVVTAAPQAVPAPTSCEAGCNCGLSCSGDDDDDDDDDADGEGEDEAAQSSRKTHKFSSASSDPKVQVVIASMNGDLEEFNRITSALGDDFSFDYVLEGGWNVLLGAVQFGPVTCGVGHCAIVKILAERGTNLDHQDETGIGAIAIATRLGLLDIATVLCDHNCTVDLKDHEDRTALQDASFSGKLSCVELLVNKGANVQAVANDGVTPVMAAALGGKLSVVKYLVKQGADIFARDSLGRNSFMLACWQGHQTTAKWLWRQGTDIMQRCNDGNNALMLAAQWNHIQLCASLASLGCNPGLTNLRGESALTHYGSLVDKAIADDPHHDADDPLDPEHPEAPRLTAVEKREREEEWLRCKTHNVSALASCWKHYLELQRREACWQRRKNALIFLAGTNIGGSTLMPMAAEVELLRQAQEALDLAASIAPVDRSTPAADRSFLLSAVLGKDGLQRKIVMFL